MNNKINLGFDGNNFAFKALGVYKGVNGNKLYNLKEEKDDFLKLLSTNFIAELNRFKPILNKVVVVVDSRSWRYDYYSDYKGKRKKPLNVNWENYTKLVEYFYKILEKRGIIISRSIGSEGDDLIYGWAKYFNDLKQNFVILSMDGDLSQLVNYKNGVFTVVYDNRYTRFFGTKEFFDTLDNKTTETVIDIFSIGDELELNNEMDSEIKLVFNNLLKKGTKINIIDTDDFLFKKIITGDTGDNVQAAYFIKKNEKVFGIGEKTADKIVSYYRSRYGSFKLTDLYNDSDILNNISESIRTNMKLDNNLTVEIKNNLKSNIKLMVLNENEIPSEIHKSIFQDIDDKKNNEIKIETFNNISTLLKGIVNFEPRQIKGLF